MLLTNYCEEGAVLGVVWTETMHKTWFLPSGSLWSSTEGKREISGTEKTVSHENIVGALWMNRSLLAGGVGRSGDGLEVGWMAFLFLVGK